MVKLEEVILLGTGTSGCVPNTCCLTDPEKTCKTCILSQQFTIINNQIWNNKNKRRNTSCLLRFRMDNGNIKNIVIDTGKTFYESSMEWFSKYNIRKIDAVILTHGHADAILGLDDLRQWTIGVKKVQEFIPIYLSKETMNTVAQTFPYLVHKEFATGGGDISALKFNIIDEEGLKPFYIENEIKITPISVHHGFFNEKPFICLGFRADNFTYISDSVKIPDESREIIKNSDIIIIDALKYKPHKSHFSLDEAISELTILKPTKMAYLTGLSHYLEHEQVTKELSENELLKKENFKVEVAWDGLRIKM